MTREFQGVSWHHLPTETVLELLETNDKLGLGDQEVVNRQRRFGPNRLPERAGPGPLVRFAQQFQQPLVYLLLIAGGVTLLLRDWVDAGVILGVVLLNALVGFFQESKARQALEALARSVRTRAIVMRGGRRQEVSSEMLVPGDLVFLQSGDKIPADLRLVSGRELRVDEAALTGESLPSEKQVLPLAAETLLAERRNMAYSSSLVTYGQATGVVVATGMATEVGRISQLIASASDLQTPLTRRIAQFSGRLLWVIVALSLLGFVVGIARGESVVNMFMTTVALAVGAIPEGLPAAVTITLAIGVARMAKRRAVVRRLPAVETLGSTTVVCSDKTGTLTENQMTVREIWAGGETFHVTGAGYAPHGEFRRLDGGGQATVIDPRARPALLASLLAGQLCSDARLVVHEGHHAVQGDPTEGALVVAAEKAGLSAEATGAEAPRIDVIPFESQHQFMATLHDAAAANGRRVAYVKGAVERILERCYFMLGADGSVRLLDELLIIAQAERLAAQGLRVLAVARRELPSEHATLVDRDVSAGLTFLGLVGMIDPPRPEAIVAVRACQTAGIRTKMITGDHLVTAQAIAAQLGIASPDETGSVKSLPARTGEQLAALSDDELREEAERCAVFARVSPEQKLRLVRALQARGHVVAMTGDGVNDGPALKQANIGIAMGFGGTEVAKEAADIVLTDDNFATIEAAIEEGRGVFDNLTKFLVWTLPTNLGEGLVILIATLFGATLPILPLQILWINLTTSVLLGLALAFEPKERNIMLRSPRAPDQPIMTRELLVRILLVGSLLLVAAFGLFEWALQTGATVEVARTIAVNVFVFGEMLYLLNCRSLRSSVFELGLFSNRWIWAGIGAMTAVQLAFVYLPVMNHAFGSAPLGVSEWLVVGVAAVTIWLIVGVEKWWLRRREQALHGTPSLVLRSSPQERLGVTARTSRSAGRPSKLSLETSQ